MEAYTPVLRESSKPPARGWCAMAQAATNTPAASDAYRDRVNAEQPPALPATPPGERREGEQHERTPVHRMRPIHSSPRGCARHKQQPSRPLLVNQNRVNAQRPPATQQLPGECQNGRQQRSHARPQMTPPTQTHPTTLPQPSIGDRLNERAPAWAASPVSTTCGCVEHSSPMKWKIEQVLRQS